MIPPNLKEGLDRYQYHHIKTGGFLEAVLSGDMSDARGRADPISLAAIDDVVDYIAAELPAESWGSRQVFKDWTTRTEAGNES